MTTDEFLKLHKELCQKMYDISYKKNKDYSGSDSNPFRNFQNVEMLGITSTEHGFLVRMTDKMARLTNFVNTKTLHVKDESAEDTLLDLANYSLLMLGYLKSKQVKGVEL